jgi:uncharacterized protein
MKRNWLLLILVFCFTSGVFAQTVHTVESIPNPKQTYNGYVSNPDNILDASTVGRVNAVLQQLEDSTTIQVAVAVVNSIGDEVPADFRTKLFRAWGVGQPGIDNGLLVLVVMDQRRFEFEVGYGLEGIITDIMSVRIQQTYMVPLAKEGKMNEAILAGVMQINQILIDPQYRSEVYADSLSNENTKWFRHPVSNTALIIFASIYAIILAAIKGGRKSFLQKAPAYVKNHFSQSYDMGKLAVLNIGVPVVFYANEVFGGSLRVFEMAIFVYLFIMVLLLEKRLRVNRYINKESTGKEPQEVYNLFAKSHSEGWIMADIFFPLPFLLYSLINKGKMKSLRNIAPVSDRGVPMTKMAEKEDDGFLKAFQIKEEALRSVDYDVWIDEPTKQVKIYRFENFYSKYKTCPNCKSKSYLMSKNETLVSPSYTSTGTGQKTYTCKACNHVKKETYTIAKLTKSSSSGSGGGYGGGGGGGSFGGGSSGGGGGGSSW